MAMHHFFPTTKRETRERDRLLTIYNEFWVYMVKPSPTGIS